MNKTPVNFAEKLAQMSEFWSPRIVAQINDYQFRLVKIRGDFVWHSHPETDEAFIVLDGSMTIDFRDGSLALKPGEMYVVPRGVEHKPFAERECTLLLVEPAGTVNTGDAGGERTVRNDIWI
jgi:mannose-6-phosphate isomerase-like protein (cupin superfamily)